MKEEKLIGTSSIPYQENCSIQVLNIKEITTTKHRRDERYYADFYNVTDDCVYFIDRIELDPFCTTLGYQLINNRLVIYNYDIVEGKKYHVVNRILKYYDVIDNISLNLSADDIITELGFNLPEKDRKRVELVSERLKKMDDYLEYLDSITELDGTIPLVDNTKKKKKFINKKKESKKMLNTISREEFTKYFTKLITNSDRDIKINQQVININDYKDDGQKVKNVFSTKNMK